MTKNQQNHPVPGELRNIAIIGYGNMGRVLEQAARERGVAIAAIAGKLPGSDVYAELSALNADVDCIIDFSHHSNIEKILRYARENNKPLVIAVTGFSEAQQKQIQAASATVPIVFSQNLSLGVNILKEVAVYISRALGSRFDIELIEKHHNRKEDAPSGTAKMLLSALCATGEKNIVNGRHGLQKRAENEIGVHAVRGGTIVGEHSVIFAGNDEIIEIKHTALSKRIFADGALRAAAFLISQPAGLYGMDEVLSASKTEGAIHN
ncbi:MAG: 4-hydroxy-tetrahydrodipicolinate reductase [Prevotellaceae bacterium]|jgi:4-hydroxy-tetrahydrodipicolinate reductase|nr:4-hydroxy-tetrahydrodipicolinate reductase [Prevotellaceae bacterium]